MSALLALTNPFVRKVLPVISLFVAEFAGNTSDEANYDALLDFIKRIIPVFGAVKSLQVKDVTEADMSALLEKIGVNIRPEDVALWVKEIEKFADSGEDTLQKFFTGPAAKRMIQDVLSRTPRSDVAAIPAVDVPMYDPETGLFHFS